MYRNTLHQIKTKKKGKLRKILKKSSGKMYRNTSTMRHKCTCRSASKLHFCGVNQPSHLHYYLPYYLISRSSFLPFSRSVSTPSLIGLNHPLSFLLFIFLSPSSSPPFVSPYLFPRVLSPFLLSVLISSSSLFL